MCDEKIASFVFFDIEATGLDDLPKITEIAFTACSRDHLLGTNGTEIPRALYQLLLPVNPMKVIHPEATRITGLDNFLLEHLKKIDANTIELIRCFLNQLNKPVCLVAHNGNRYDYPILKRQLKNLSCSFAEDLLCVDSIDIFKVIDEQKTTNLAIDEFLSTNLQEIQRKNEQTPSKPSPFTVITRAPYDKPTAAKRLFNSSTSTTPSTICSSMNISNSNTSNTSQSSTAIKVTTSNSQSSARISYKLVDIYKRLWGDFPDVAHNAAADTMTLLKCAIATKHEFVQSADSLAKKFH